MPTFLPTHDGRAFRLQPQTASILEMEEEFGVTYTTGPAHTTVETARAWAAEHYPGSTVLDEQPRHFLTMQGYEVWRDSTGYYCRRDRLHGPYPTFDEATAQAQRGETQ